MWSFASDPVLSGLARHLKRLLHIPRVQYAISEVGRNLDSQLSMIPKLSLPAGDFDIAKQATLMQDYFNKIVPIAVMLRSMARVVKSLPPGTGDLSEAEDRQP